MLSFGSLKFYTVSTWKKNTFWEKFYENIYKKWGYDLSLETLTLGYCINEQWLREVYKKYTPQQNLEEVHNLYIPISPQSKILPMRS
jgi:hypothetical protein